MTEKERRVLFFLGLMITGIEKIKDAAEKNMIWEGEADDKQHYYFKKAIECLHQIEVLIEYKDC